MARLYGKSYTRQELLSHVSDMDHLGGVRLYTMDDGSARGLRVVQFRTGGGLTFDVLLDRGMDIGQAAHNGRPIGWQSAAGYPHPSYYEASAPGFLRFFHGGLMAGCGLDNVGEPNVDEGESLPLHGRLSTLPAGHVSYGGEWVGDDYGLWVQGQMRQAALFGSNLLLTRRIWAHLGENALHLEDTLENQGHHPAPYQILYHCNFGFPLLSPEAELLVDAEMWARDDAAARGLASWNRFYAPVADYPEQVFYHLPRADEAGYAQAALINRPLGLGAYVRFRLAELPHLIQWKMQERGTYVLGLEPANCWVEGRARDRQRGILRFLEPGERVELRLEIGVLTDMAVMGGNQP